MLMKLSETQIQKLEQLIAYYFEENNFSAIHDQRHEGYKWVAMRLFQTEDVTEAADKKFFAALKAALTEAQNLLYQNNRDTLFRLAAAYDEELRSEFQKLEQGDRQNLKERLIDFVTGTKAMIKRDATRNWKPLAASDAMTCLAFLHPDQYYIYRPMVLDEAYKFLGKPDNCSSNAVDRACEFHDLCELILQYIGEHHEDKLKKYLDFVRCDGNMYADESGHLLVQNLLYALKYSDGTLDTPIQRCFLKKAESPLLAVSAPSRVNAQSQKAKTQKYDIDKAYMEDKKNKEWGDRGENLIFNELYRQGLKVTHISKDNDAAHYDILCEDNSGNTIFVEVKTVAYSASRKPRIYMTQGEVQLSMKAPEKYYLYVLLLKTKNDQGVYEIFKGDVTKPPLNLEYSHNGLKYFIEFEKVKILP